MTTTRLKPRARAPRARAATAWMRSRTPSFASTPATASPPPSISASVPPAADQREHLALAGAQPVEPGRRRRGWPHARDPADQPHRGLGRRPARRRARPRGCRAASSSGGVSLSVMPLTPACSASSRYSSRSNVLRSRTRIGGPSSATIRRVASIPSMSGIRTSISTTSGCRRARLGDGGDAVARLADDLDGRLHLEPHPDALAHELEVVDDQDADAHDTPAAGARTAGARRPRSRRPARGPASTSPPNDPHAARACP